MAKDFKQWEGNDDDFKVSKFNPAALKMQRLHEYNDLIDVCMMNPQAYNGDYQDYNFNLLINAINVLFHEIDSKLKEKERDEIQELKDAIDKNIKEYPIMETKRGISGNSLSWNSKRWEIFKGALEKWLKLVRQYADNHGLDTPLKDESSYF